MTQFPFDQFSKQWLEDVLAPLGRVERSLEVPGEARLVDLYFEPSERVAVPPQGLTLLERIAVTPCLIEAFRNPPSANEIRLCLLKLLYVQAEVQRQAQREEERVAESQLPRLWILAPTVSASLREGLAAQVDSEWPSGIYFLGRALRTAVVAIAELPVLPETLWLRLVGRGAVQEQAIAEVLALPSDDRLRAEALRGLATWKITIEVGGQFEDEDRSVLMALSQAYLEWEQQVEARGIQQGVEQEKRLVVENLLRLRFGEVDAALAGIIPALLALPTEEYTCLLLELSRQDLLNRFQPPNR